MQVWKIMKGPEALCHMPIYGIMATILLLGSMSSCSSYLLFVQIQTRMVTLCDVYCGSTFSVVCGTRSLFESFTNQGLT